MEEDFKYECVQYTEKTHVAQKKLLEALYWTC